MSVPLLSRYGHRPGPILPVLGEVELPLARLHELCGPARYTMAMLIAAATKGPVFWIAPAWQTGGPNPDGMLAFAAPQRFTFLAPQRSEDVLWTLEEVLRSGAVPLVIGDIPAPPGLTAVRRMHLAAETGGKEGANTPLGLILTPGEGGAPGVETRWHMAPAHTPTQRRWHLSRRRARTAPPTDWTVQRQAGRFHLEKPGTATSQADVPPALLP